MPDRLPGPRTFATVSLLALIAAASPFAASPQRDPAAVLTAMRQAIGPGVDTVRAFTVGGSLMRTRASMRKSVAFDVKALLPEHYLTVQRDFDNGGPLPIDITYYRGFSGSTLIRRTDSNIPFPPEPGPSSPEAIAQRDRNQMLQLRRELARFCLVLLGRSMDGYPLTFSDGGPDTSSGRAADVVHATGLDGFAMRLYVDSATHLPVMITWDAPPEVVMMATMTSTVTTRGGQVISRTPPAASAPSAPPPVPTSTVPWKLEVSDFKADDGLRWPRRFRLTVDGKDHDEFRFGRYKINPKLEPRDFAIRLQAPRVNMLGEIRSARRAPADRHLSRASIAWNRG